MHAVAYNNGFAAAKQGESMADCPYAAETLDRESWLSGWCDGGPVCDTEAIESQCKSDAAGFADALAKCSR